MFKSKFALILAVLLLIFVSITIVAAVSAPAGEFTIASSIIKFGHACSSGCAI